LINGDLKHEFGTINQQEERSVLELLRFLQERGVSVIVVRGNHDVLLEPILKRAGFASFEEYLEGDFFFCHGHTLPRSQAFKGAKTVIIGHEHPALALSDGLRQETGKCFLFASHGRKSLIVLPSFSRATEGTDVLRQEFLSPMLTPAVLRKAEVFLVIDEAVGSAGTLVQIEKALKRF
ncbi:TPA: hypothetical protein HA251_06070, partial [Candidatus Woesearchaeota archaeon]|nr:hypothetical protein [Candidatus Woesearchaeota archaeon]